MLTVNIYVLRSGSDIWDLVISVLAAYMVVELLLFIWRRLPVLGL